MFEINKRAAELDFLRGVAVILVLFCHQYIFLKIAQFGWIGVDLFFVLSGFLVSGLLFSEFKKYGNIKPGLFLIRRGFKIYPLFYFSIVVTIVLSLYFPNCYIFPGSHTLFLNHNGIAAAAFYEVFFLQSYIFGFWTHHWSLSVEEMFYFFFVISFFLLLKQKQKLKAQFKIETLFLVFLVCILFLRIFTQIFAPNDYLQHNAFHLRIDSLMAGVFVSYLYNFRKEKLFRIYEKQKRILPYICFLLLLIVYCFWLMSKPLLLTIGFTCLWIAFAGLLVIFLLNPLVGMKIEKIIGNRSYKGVCKIGYYSYSIYLFHYYVVRYLAGEHWAEIQYNKGNWGIWAVILCFILYFVISVILGIILSKAIEVPMLKFRDKIFPRRTI